MSELDEKAFAAAMIASAKTQDDYYTLGPKIDAAIRAYLAAAPAPTVSGEPVAWLRVRDDGRQTFWERNVDGACTPLYAHPAPTVSGEPTWADESKAMHWIDRYAAGLDDEPQMDRILECVAAPTRAEVLEDVARFLDENPDRRGRFLAEDVRALAGEKP